MASGSVCCTLRCVISVRGVVYTLCCVSSIRGVAYRARRSSAPPLATEVLRKQATSPSLELSFLAFLPCERDCGPEPVLANAQGWSRRKLSEKGAVFAAVAAAAPIGCPTTAATAESTAPAARPTRFARICESKGRPCPSIPVYVCPEPVLAHAPLLPKTSMHFSSALSGYVCACVCVCVCVCVATCEASPNSPATPTIPMRTEEAPSTDASRSAATAALSVGGVSCAPHTCQTKRQPASRTAGREWVWVGKQVVHTHTHVSCVCACARVTCEMLSGGAPAATAAATRAAAPRAPPRRQTSDRM